MTKQQALHELRQYLPTQTYITSVTTLEDFDGFMLDVYQIGLKQWLANLEQANQLAIICNLASLFLMLKGWGQI